MPIDFPRLVLGPAMKTFAIRVTIAPAASRPGAAAYCIRGIWSSKPIVIETGTGFHSTNQPTLGIRLADFDEIGQAYPMQRDFLSLQDDPAGICWEITDAKPDGQGGSELELRIVKGTLAEAASDAAAAQTRDE